MPARGGCGSHVVQHPCERGEGATRHHACSGRAWSAHRVAPAVTVTALPLLTTCAALSLTDSTVHSNPSCCLYRYVGRCCCCGGGSGCLWYSVLCCGKRRCCYSVCLPGSLPHNVPAFNSELQQNPQTAAASLPGCSCTSSASSHTAPHSSRGLAVVATLTLHLVVGVAGPPVHLVVIAPSLVAVSVVLVVRRMPAASVRVQLLQATMREQTGAIQYALDA